MSRFTIRQLLDSLRSPVCPACGKHKKYAQTLCVSCYRELPREQQRALYNRVGEGYERAFVDAMVSLGVDDPKMTQPEATP